jgi:RNA polymerase sigma-70 factor (ECF subfamily)
MDWDQAVSDIGPRLYRYFGAAFASQVASDLTQETLIRLVQKFDEGAFDSSRGSLVMYAYGIARLVRLEAYKETPNEDLFGDPIEFETRSSTLTTETGAHEAELQSLRLREAIEKLNETQKQIVLLHIDQELTLQEIGTLVRLPLNTVKSHIHRAKEILRITLTSEGTHYEK